MAATALKTKTKVVKSQATKTSKASVIKNKVSKPKAEVMLRKTLIEVSKPKLQGFYPSPEVKEWLDKLGPREKTLMINSACLALIEQGIKPEDLEVSPYTAMKFRDFSADIDRRLTKVEEVTKALVEGLEE